MSVIIVPQLSTKHNSLNWKPNLSSNPNVITNINKLVENDLMISEICEFYSPCEFKCLKYTSKSGSSPNIVFVNTKGPIVYYKETGFSNSEYEVIERMLYKVIGKQVIR